MDRDLIRQIVRETIAEMFSPIVNTSQAEPDQQWQNLKSAWEPLGYPSYSALYKDVRSGLFRQGKELCDRRKPGAKIARLQIDLIAARRRLRENPAKRRGV